MYSKLSAFFNFIIYREIIRIIGFAGKFHTVLKTYIPACKHMKKMPPVGAAQQNYDSKRTVFPFYRKIFITSLPFLLAYSANLAELLTLFFTYVTRISPRFSIHLFRKSIAKRFGLFSIPSGYIVCR